MRIKSKFLLYTENQKGEFVLFNSLSKKMIKTSSKNKSRLLYILENPQQDIQLSDYLYKNSFLVSDNERESELAENTYISVCHSKQVLHLIILPTYKCNFRCLYCYESFPDVVMTRSIQEDVYIFAKKMLNEYSALQISWFGGEPLLELDTILYLSSKFQSLCRNEGKPYLADITTNGYLLTLDTFKKLLKCNIRTYQITIDGLETTHNKYRHLSNGGSTYQTIINNLKVIRDEIKSAMFQIVIRTNLTKGLLDSIDEHLSYINEEFLKDTRFKHVCRIAFSYNNEEIKDELLNNDNLINSSFSSLPQNIINDNNRRYFIESFRDFISGGASICYAGKSSSLIIDPLGNLLKCTVCLDDYKNVVGDIYNGIIKEKFDRWIERPTNSGIFKPCSNCPIYPICLNVSCPYEHFSAFDRKRKCCSSIIKDTLLYIKTLSFDDSICENIDNYFTINNREDYLTRKEEYQ